MKQYVPFFGDDFFGCDFWGTGLNKRQDMGLPWEWCICTYIFICICIYTHIQYYIVQGKRLFRLQACLDLPWDINIRKATKMFPLDCPLVIYSSSLRSRRSPCWLKERHNINLRPAILGAAVPVVSRYIHYVISHCMLEVMYTWVISQLALVKVPCLWPSQLHLFSFHQDLIHAPLHGGYLSNNHRDSIWFDPLNI